MAEPTEDEKKAARDNAKGLIKEAFGEWLTEREEKLKEEDKTRTERTGRKSIFQELFGG